MKVKVQYKINTPQVEKEQQKQLTEKIKNAIRFFTNDIQYKILLNKDGYGVTKIDRENTKSTKKKINAEETAVTITVPVEATRLIQNQEQLQDSLYKYINSGFELSITGFVESLEVIDDGSEL